MDKENKMETQELLDHIVELLLDKKGEDITVVDLKGITSVTDYFVIATGNSTTHIKALADDISHKLKKEYRMLPWHVEGTESKKWILIDYVDVVVHIFDEETRQYYGLEKLWEDAKITHIKDEAETAAG